MRTSGIGPGLIALLWCGLRLEAVVINEIHFQPPSSEGKIHEFIELFNPEAFSVSLDGWRLEGGIEFTFPAGTDLPSGGFLVVCRNREALAKRFPESQGGLLLGDYTGSLDNGGENLILADGSNACVDAVPYRSRLPWPEAAAGNGGSLQRLCASAPSGNPLNWTGIYTPTPLSANGRSQCPPPSLPAQRVVISEIFYHPPEPPPSAGLHKPGEDGEDLEFVELHNPGAAAVALDGWNFTDGIDFVFPEGASIPAGGYLAVCRNAAALRNRFPGAAAVGDFTGKLSNSGERIALSDRNGGSIDAMEYLDSGDWPYNADGGGRSLEKVVLAGSGLDPGNWVPTSMPRLAFATISGEGGIGFGVKQRFVLSINGPGQFIIDNVVLEKVDLPGVNLLPNGNFNIGLNGWTAAGTASASVWHPTAGKDGTGALILSVAALCPGGECKPDNGVVADVPFELKSQDRFRVSLDINYHGGSLALRGGLFRGAAASLDILATPGSANSAGIAGLPPAISSVRRFPAEPKSDQEVWITARINALSSVDASLTYNAGFADENLALADDGLHHDGAAGDGVYGARIPALPHNTQVRFWISAADREGRTGVFPHLADPQQPQPKELWGYYVNDLQPESVLPVYHILLDGVNGEDYTQVNTRLSCQVLRPGSFAFRGDLYPAIGVRFRGNTACLIKKRNFKVVFNRGRHFIAMKKDRKKLNLNGLWTDKALVREKLSWDFMREIGAPSMDTEFVRLHISGSYYGLFLYIEHPDSRFLENQGLDPGGNLYKARQPPRNPGEIPIGVDRHSAFDYPTFWEEETNSNGDFSDIAEFVNSMHDDGRDPSGPSAAFWQDRSHEEMIIGYQISQVVLNNIDSFAKNHFLYHDLSSDRWGFIGWDMDLTFGKFFAPDAIGPGREVGTLNDILMCNPPRVPFPIPTPLDPWFTTTIIDFQAYNWLIDFFFRAGDGYYQRAYLTRIWNILDEKFRSDAYAPKLDELEQLLFEEQADDFNRWGRFPTNVKGYPPDMASNLDLIKQQIDCHREFLTKFISTGYPEIPRRPKIKFTEILYNPEEANQELEFVELKNFDDHAVDMSGWTLEGGIDFMFPPGSVIPAGESALVAKSPVDFRTRYVDREIPFVFGPFVGRLANEGDTIELRDSGPGYPAMLDRIQYEEDGAWPELLPGQSLELALMAADRDSNNPASWKASVAQGGTPGREPQKFRRGDANTDTLVDVSDPIFLLQALFLGGKASDCEDAADGDNDGELAVTDAIYVLRYLFLQGPEPPQPFAACDVDSDRDELTCRSYPECAAAAAF